MTETPTPAAATLRLIYTGQRLTRSGPLTYRYVREDLTPWGGMRKPLVAGHRVGTLVEVTLSAPPDEDRIWTSGDDGPRPLGRAEAPEEIVIQWELEDGLARSAQAKAATERRLAKEIGSPLTEALASLRAALDGLPWHQRHAATLLILDLLR